MKRLQTGLLKKLLYESNLGINIAEANIMIVNKYLEFKLVFIINLFPNRGKHDIENNIKP